jgi:DNA topoisomerase-2
MKQTSGPIITQSKLKVGYTMISYIPDFSRFKHPNSVPRDATKLRKGCLERYPKEVMPLFKKFVVDIATLLPNVNVYFNDEKIKVKNMLEYARMYYDESSVITQCVSLRHEGSDVVIIGSAEAEAPKQPVSFVNGQITKDGGQHTQSWTKLIYSKLLEHLNKKDGVKFTLRDISPYFQFYVHSRVNKPKFDGQNKNKLVNPQVAASISDFQFKKLLKWDVVATIKSKVSKSKEMVALKKIESGRKPVLKIDGYDPANRLGTESILIVCEGLSAKSYAVSGIQTGALGKQGRNYFGILPLRGKFLNVKNVNKSKIGENKVVSDLIKVLGLKFGVDYALQANYKALNYGTLMILTDADKDGIHIEGLLLNFFMELFPSLLKKQGFIVSMKTPVVKVFKKGGQDLLFYNESTFEEYRRKHPNVRNFKYYKGLGTTPSKDVSASFGLKMVRYDCDTNAENSANKVFLDELSDQRKTWLSAFDPQVVHCNLDKFNDPVIRLNISDFMEHEMIKFSYEDCKRSLPNSIDGFKESQRKVIYAIRKKFKSTSAKSEKVAQLSGCVAAQTDYKHGEQNLCETIIKFAQDFVGSNNIPLLYPDGQFGTRLEGGKDAASARYIFTKPQPVLKYIIREEDDAILNYTPEGEPEFFVPIIPIILVNGSVGIGTGWSCFVPQYNPKCIIEHISKRLHISTSERRSPKLSLKPFYKNFKGKIIPTEDQKKFTTYGKMKLVNNNADVLVTELPVGMWIDKFKSQCYLLQEKHIIAGDIINESTTTEVKFLLKDVQDINSIKLTSSLHTTNMVLFNSKNIITKYSSIDDIFEDFFILRLHYYNLRKTHQINILHINIDILENKLKFILKVVNDKNFIKQHERVIEQVLEDENYLKQNGSFSYLLSLSISAFTTNKIEDLTKTLAESRAELSKLEKTSIKRMWLNELKELLSMLE